MRTELSPPAHALTRSTLAWRSLSYVFLAYLVALAAAAATWQALPGWSLLGRLAAADLVATAVVFGFSFAADNTSVYDPYWSLAPPVAALGLASLGAAAQGWTARLVVVTLLVLAWAARLTWNWMRTWPGLAYEDWRYRDMRAPTGRLYWLVSLLGLHLVPTLFVLAGMLPFPVVLVESTAPFNALDLLATAVTALAVGLEAVADEQLLAFRRRTADGPPGAICEEGLWAHSRHPNYFGEVTFWVGLGLFGLAAGGPPWHLAGAVGMVALFVFISIPLIDRRSLKRRPGYARHMERVSALVPWFRRDAPG